jgi:hypothetical protein
LSEVATARGSAYRYAKRQRRWTAEVRRWPRLRHHGWWLLHNVIAHPLVGVWPATPAIRFHDLTSRRLNRNVRQFASVRPAISRRAAWVLHNVVGHLAIGLLPCRATFAWHDRSAEAMGVADWV